MSTVKIKDIAMPVHYLREKVKASYITELLEDLALKNGVKDWKELIVEKGKKPKFDWPFPPIEIARNEKQVLPPAEKGEKPSATKKKLKAPKKKYFAYELIDGTHRLTVARRLKLKEISATIKQILDPGERFLQQYLTNGGPRGLRLDRDDRDNAIRIMGKEFNFSQKKLVEVTGLDQTSISRILSGKMRKEGPRKAYEKKGKENAAVGPFAQSAKTPETSGKATMTANGFVERWQLCCSEFPRLRSEVVAYLSTVANEKGLIQLIDLTKELLTVLEKVHTEKFPPKAAATA